MQEKVNAELVANIGNLVNRTLTFIERFCESRVGKVTEPLEYYNDVHDILEAYEKIDLKRALKGIMALSKKANQYFQEQEPWKAIKRSARYSAGNIVPS